MKMNIHFNKSNCNLNESSQSALCPSSKAWLVEELELEDKELELELGGGGLKAVEQILRYSQIFRYSIRQFVSYKSQSNT